jgi:adenylyltransferase/sulfurtransferase
MVRQISVQDLAARLAAKAPVYLLDVRQAWEHEHAAIPGSILLPLPELHYRLGEVQPPAGALVVAYCHHGIRSMTAAALLAQSGIANVVSLNGGIDAWSCQIDPNLPRY